MTEYRLYSAHVQRPDNRFVPPAEAQPPYVAIMLQVGKSTKGVELKYTPGQALALAEQLLRAAMQAGGIE